MQSAKPAPACAPWLQALPAGKAEALLALGVPRALVAGDALFRQGDPGDSLAVVQEGLLKVSVVTARGREIALDYVGPGGVLGELAVFDGEPRVAAVSAVEASKVMIIPASAVRAFLAADASAAAAVLAALSRRLRRTNALIEDAAGSGLEPRLARAILRLAPESGDGAVELHLKQADIAAFAGLSRENVNRQLRDWAARGLIALGRGRLALRRPAALAVIAQDGNDASPQRTLRS